MSRTHRTDSIRAALALLALFGIAVGCGGDSTPPPAAPPPYAFGNVFATPGAANAGETFDVTFDIYDFGTTTPATLGAPLNVSIAMTNGSGTLLGTTSLAVAATPATFTALSVWGSGTVTLTLSATSVASGSVAIVITPLTLTLGATSDRIINEPFAVTGTLTRSGGGAATVINGPTLDLTATGGAGTLSGATSDVIAGGTVTWSAVSYNRFASLTLDVVHPAVTLAATAPQLVEPNVAITPSVYGPFAVGDGQPDAVFTFTDFLGAAYNASGDTFAWEIENTGTTVIVASGSGAPSGGTSHSLAIPAVVRNTAATYQVRGWIQGGNKTAQQYRLVGAAGLLEYLTTEAGFVGAAFSHNIATEFTATSFSQVGGTLPPGLTLSGAGVVSGTPTTVGVYRALLAIPNGGGDRFLRLTISIMNLDFRTAAAPAVTAVSRASQVLAWSAVPSVAAGSLSRNVRIYYPTTGAGPFPLIVHCPGNGFRYNQYDDIFTVWASYGYVICSVDSYPFGETFQTRANLIRGGLAYMVTENATGGSPMQNRIDLTRVTFTGHSRGGAGELGATAMENAAGAGNADAGISMEGMDPGEIWPVAAPYVDSDDVPKLHFGAERDGDLTYPFCPRIAERIAKVQPTAPMTYAEVYGSDHDFTADSGGSGGTPYNTRAETHQLHNQLVLQFLNRYIQGDTTYDYYLHGPAWEGSRVIAVWELNGPGMASTVLVDRFQTAPSGTNDQGGTNTATGATYAEAYPYPGSTAPYVTEVISGRITSLSAGSSVAFALGAGLDVSAKTYLKLRTNQFNTQGYPTWLDGMIATLTDAAGASASVDLLHHLPGWPETGGVSGQYAGVRHHGISVALSEFTALNPSLSLSTITELRLELFASAPASQRLDFDDIRFED